MHFDLELFLVGATALTGAIWALDHWVFAKRRLANTVASASQPPADTAAAPAAQPAPKEPWYVEYSKSFFPVLLIVLLLRGFVVEPFRIPSGSMMPTLLVGDFILVNKFAYGVRLPVVHTEILDVGEPERGDIAVFRFPPQPSEDYIKRIVGLPGDYIVYADKQLYVNGEQVPHNLVGTYRGSGTGRIMNGAAKLEETLGQVEHAILLQSDVPTKEGEWRVPPNHYFVLGDNRDNSNDSRYWGFVPDEHLVGKAFAIWMHWDMRAGEVKWQRIGTVLN